MTNESRLPGQAEIPAGIPAVTLKQIAIYTTAYVVFIGIVTLLIGPISLAPGLLGGLSFLYLPSAAALILLYLSTVVRFLLTGRIAGPLANAIAIIALTVFVTIATLTQTISPGLGILALPLLLTGATFAGVTLATPISGLARILLTAIFAVAAGWLALAAPASIGLPDGAAVGWILFAGFLVAAVTTLPAVFEGHSNEYLAFVGDYFGRREVPWVLGAACVTFLAYCQYLRPALVSAAPLGMSAVEWGVLALILIQVGVRALGFVRSISQARKPGELRTLVQSIAYDRGSLEAAHAAVDSFVAGGKKEGLIVYVSGAMLENRVPPRDIEAVLAEIVEYADEPVPALAIAWAAGDVAGKNRRRRLAVAGSLIAAAATAMGEDGAPGAESQGLSAVSTHTGGM